MKKHEKESMTNEEEPVFIPWLGIEEVKKEVKIRGRTIRLLSHMNYRDEMPRVFFLPKFTGSNQWREP